VEEDFEAACSKKGEMGKKLSMKLEMKQKHDKTKRRLVQKVTKQHDAAKMKKQKKKLAAKKEKWKAAANSAFQREELCKTDGSREA